MQFEAVIDAKPLLAAVRRAVTVTPRNAQVPILSHVRLIAKDNRVTVIGTNLDCWVHSEADAETASGDIVLPGHQLAAALATMESGAAVRMTLADNRLTMASHRTSYGLPPMDPADWPQGKDAAGATVLEVNAAELVASLDRLRFATEDTASRPYLNGVFFDFSADRMVSTNGHILGTEPGCWKIGKKKPDGFILPVDAVAPIKSALDGAEDCEIRVSAGGQLVAFAAGGNCVVTKVIDGVYPDYGRTIPRDFASMFRVEHGDAVACLRRVSSITDGKSRAIAVRVTDSEVGFRARSEDANFRADDACGAIRVERTPPEFGANGRYLTWAVDSLLGAKSVEFHVNDPGGPVMLIDGADTDRRRLRIVMPMRV